MTSILSQEELSKLREILDQRHVSHLVHFTRAENIASIFRHGLRPRNHLEGESVEFVPNDDQRLDDCADAVCTSVEFPNYRMFYKLRLDHPEAQYAVLRIDSAVTYDQQCWFLPTNAASSSVKLIPWVQRIGPTALSNLFVETPTMKRDEAFPSNYPTDPQAEVLVFGVIPVDSIVDVSFLTSDALDSCRALIPERIKLHIEKGLFSKRFPS